MIGVVSPGNRETGLILMESPVESRQLNQWIFETIHPFLKGRILEIGAGSGEFSTCLMQNDIRLHLSDPIGQNCNLLQNKFDGNSGLKSIQQIKLSHEAFESEYAPLLGQFDTVLVVNTIEHKPNEQQAFVNVNKLLRPDGHLIALLPVNTALYNESSYGLREWKRQNRRVLRKILGKDLEALKTQYFTVISMVRWALSRYMIKPGKREEPFENPYTLQVPVFRVIDEIFFHHIGLSVIAVRKKIS